MQLLYIIPSFHLFANLQNGVLVKLEIFSVLTEPESESGMSVASVDIPKLKPQKNESPKQPESTIIAGCVYLSFYHRTSLYDANKKENYFLQVP